MTKEQREAEKRIQAELIELSKEWQQVTHEVMNVLLPKVESITSRIQSLMK